MRLKKTYVLQGTVTSAKGFWRRRVIGKSVRAVVSVTGKDDDFSVKVNRIFRISGHITEVPLAVNIFPGRNLSVEDYAHVFRTVLIREVMDAPDAKVSISFTLAEWMRMDDICVVFFNKSWISRLLLDAVRVDGEAEMVKSEEVAETSKK